MAICLRRAWRTSEEVCVETVDSGQLSPQSAPADAGSLLRSPAAHAQPRVANSKSGAVASRSFRSSLVVLSFFRPFPSRLHDEGSCAVRLRRQDGAKALAQHFRFSFTRRREPAGEAEGLFVVRLNREVQALSTVISRSQQPPCGPPQSPRSSRHQKPSSETVTRRLQTSTQQQQCARCRRAGSSALGLAPRSRFSRPLRASC